MKTKKIEVGETYFYRDSDGIEFVRVMQYVEGMGYWVKDPDGEYFWADAEELEEV